MFRFAHRLLIVVLSLLAIGTGVLGIVSYAMPMGFALLEPTWFSRAVDGYPSRLASNHRVLLAPPDPSEFRVLTFVGVWDGRVRTIRYEATFQRYPLAFARLVSEIKSTPAKSMAGGWSALLRGSPYSGQAVTNWPWVRFYPDRISSGCYCSFLEVSIWPALVLFSVYPIIALIRFVRGPFRRWRRRRRGCCVTCGYNLTGNTSGVCPECGQAISDAR